MMKSSGIDTSIYNGIKKALTVMYEHPKTTLGVLGSAILAKKLVDNIAPFHQIVNSEQNNTLTEMQNKTLQNLLEEVRSQRPEHINNPQMQKQIPLT